MSVGCYGKLPIHGDFIRFNVGAAEISVLDRWFQEGLFTGQKALGGLFSDVFDRAPASRFIFNMHSIGRVVAGVMMPSCDKTGRQFPFLIITGAPLKDFGAEVALLPGIFESFFERAYAVMKDWIGKDLKTFNGKVEQLGFTLDPRSEARRVAEICSRLKVQTLFTDTFGSAADVRKYMLVQNLVDVIKPNLAPKFAVRFPNTPGSAEAACWLEALQKLMNKHGLPTMTVWNYTHNETPAHLTVLFEELHAKYLLPLLNPERDSDVVYKLGKFGAGDDAKLAIAQKKYGALCDSATLTVPELIRKLP
jgi:type VI secretion system protein ImpM